MTISPVSNLVKTNNYHVHFTSKNNKKPQNSVQNSSSAGLKAVPVMVMMAMSPLNASNANVFDAAGNENRIELVNGIQQARRNVKKDYKLMKEQEIGINTLALKSSTGDKKIDKIQHYMVMYSPAITEYNHVTLEIVGDDGVPGDTIAFPMLTESFSSDKMPEANNELCKFVKDFMDGKNKDGFVNNGAVKEKFINKKIRPDLNGSLQNVPSRTDWITKGQQESEDFGVTPQGMPERIGLFTESGFYAISPYSTDGNNETFEAITVNRVGSGAEFKVAGLRTSKIRLTTGGSGEIGTITLNTIELYKRNSKEKAVIINNDLFNTLLEITKDTRYNNAYKCHPITASNVLVWNECIVSPYNE